MLHFGLRPPFSFDRFLELARGLIAEYDRDLLNNLPEHIAGCRADIVNPTVKSWLAFDTSLRNELAMIRAHSKKTEADKFLRHEEEYFSETGFIAAAAHRDPHIIEAEQLLDAARWAKLDELSAGHYFDLDAAIIYAYKLKMLERRDKVNTADKEGLLENAKALR